MPGCRGLSRSVEVCRAVELSSNVELLNSCLAVEPGNACRKFICTYVLCHTVSVNSHEIHAPSLGSGASVGGGEVEVASRRSGSGSDYDQWTLSVKSENHTPLPDETSTDETTPKPDEPRPRL